MSRMKKSMFILLSLMLIVSIAAACASGNNNTGDANTGSNSSTGQQQQQQEQQQSDTPKPAHIKWWGAWGEDAGPATMIEKFNEEYPHITVEYVQFKNSDEGNVKIDTSLLAAQEIDVFFNYGTARFDPRAKAGLLEDLTPYMERDGMDPKEEFGNVIEHDGKIFGLPATSLNNAIYINKKRLDDAGLQVPTQWTLEEYAEYARKLTEGSGAEKVYGSTGFHANYYWALPVRGLLGDDFWYKEDGTSNFDHPAFRTALEFKYNLENVEKVQFPYTEYAATKTQTFDLFMQERVAMAEASNAITRFISDTENYPRDFITTVAPLPVLESGQSVNYNEGIYQFGILAMGANSKEKEASWTFMKWLSTEGSKYLAQVGHIPTWKKGNKEEIMEIMFGENPEQVIDTEAFKNVVLNFDAPGYQDTVFYGYSEINKIHQDEAEKYLFDAATLDEAIETIKTKADEAINQAK